MSSTSSLSRCCAPWIIVVRLFSDPKSVYTSKYSLSTSYFGHLSDLVYPFFHFHIAIRKSCALVGKLSSSVIFILTKVSVDAICSPFVHVVLLRRSVETSAGANIPRTFPNFLHVTIFLHSCNVETQYKNNVNFINAWCSYCTRPETLRYRSRIQGTKMRIRASGKLHSSYYLFSNFLLGAYIYNVPCKIAFGLNYSLSTLYQTLLDIPSVNLGIVYWVWYNVSSCVSRPLANFTGTLYTVPELAVVTNPLWTWVGHYRSVCTVHVKNKQLTVVANPCP